MKRWILPVVIAFSALSWILLEPWRPILSGDDWGFYESVMLTIADRQAIVSDWLEPSTVGLTIPAAMLTLITGNFWTGSMFTAGLLGLMGVIAILWILRASNIPEITTAAAILAIVFFPIFFEKWARFESAVPAMALSLASMAALLAHLKRSDPDRLIHLTIAAMLLAWAILIRQNHIALLVVGCVFLYKNSASRKLVTISIWVAPSLLALILFFSSVEPTFAARVTMRSRIIGTISNLTFLEFFVKLLLFSCATSFCMLFLVDPGRAIRRVGSYSKPMLGAAAITLSVVILWILFTSETIVGFAPGTSIPHMNLVWPYPLGVLTILGSLIWPAFLPEDWRLLFCKFPEMILTLAMIFIAGTSIRGGYWEYYALESIILLFLYALIKWSTVSNQQIWNLNSPKFIGIILTAIGIACWSLALLSDWLLGKPFDVGSQQVSAMIFGSFLIMAGLFIALQKGFLLLRIGKVLLSSLFAIYVFFSWYVERSQIDMDACRLQIVEQAFRQGVAVPGNVNAPFGLMGWNTLHWQKLKWKANPSGHSLGIWEWWNEKPAVQFRIYDPAMPVIKPGESILNSGTVMVGFEQRKWVLVNANSAEPPVHALPHRPLPLTAAEWKMWLAKNSD